MKILLVHNLYRVRGGEWSVVQADAELLKNNGHEVKIFTVTNDAVDEMNVIQKLLTLFQLFYSKQSFHNICEQIEEFKPDVVHFHNIFYMIGFSCYQACVDKGVPFVHSLHNYRLLLPSGIMHNREEIIDGEPIRTIQSAVKRKDYKGSLVLSWLISRSLKKFWRSKLWEIPSVYTTATQFGKSIFESMGIPSSKIFLKPNVVGRITPKEKKGLGEYALYIGRLSEEKGVSFLVDAWKDEYIPLKIIGNGPLYDELRKTITEGKKSNIELLGFLEAEALSKIMSNAQFVIVPSRCYENFPMVVAESFAYGLPIIAPKMGSFIDLIEDGVSGCLYQPLDKNSFCSVVKNLQKEPQIIMGMSKNVSEIFNANYSPQCSYVNLIGIYNSLVK